MRGDPPFEMNPVLGVGLNELNHVGRTEWGPDRSIINEVRRRLRPPDRFNEIWRVGHQKPSDLRIAKQPAEPLLALNHNRFDPPRVNGAEELKPIINFERNKMAIVFKLLRP